MGNFTYKSAYWEQKRDEYFVLYQWIETLKVIKSTAFLCVDPSQRKQNNKALGAFPVLIIIFNISTSFIPIYYFTQHKF